MAAKPPKQLDEYQWQAQKFKEDMTRLKLDEDMLFRTALERYIVQVDVLKRLKAEIDEQAATVEREYIKGAASVYVNPLISEFNKTANAANQTCSLLAKLRAEAEKRAETTLLDDEEL